MITERRRWQWKAAYKSRTLQILAVGLVAWGLQGLGITQDMANADAQRLVDIALQVIEGAAYIVAAINRARHAHPHLALTQGRADEKNAAIAAVPPPVMPVQPGE